MIEWIFWPSLGLLFAAVLIELLVDLYDDPYESE